MIETYAFLAVFAAQVVAMSVVYPAKFGRYARTRATSLPVERLAQLFPGVDVALATERFLGRYRAANTAIAVLGLVLVGWLVGYMRGTTWDEDTVIVLISVYFTLQCLPKFIVVWLGFRFSKAHKSALLEAKRKATLQRRGLFDFVSRFVVSLAVLSYMAVVALVISMQPTPFPGYALLVTLTIVYVSQAVVVYKALYGKRSNPLEPEATRVYAMGTRVRNAVYGCILCAWFFACIFAVDLLDLKKWVPLAQSVCLLINTGFCLVSVNAPPRRPDADGLAAAKG